MSRLPARSQRLKQGRKLEAYEHLDVTLKESSGRRQKMLLPTLDAQRFRRARFVASHKKKEKLPDVWGAGNTDIATT